MTAPTLTKATIRARTEIYLKKYPPDTGYTRSAVNRVLEAGLPIGANIGVQIALQYDGREVGGDLVAGAEKRLPYLGSYSLDKGADCMDLVRNLDLLLFGRNVGDYTEDAYRRNVGKQVPWSDEEEMDLLLFKLSDRNPHATHAALDIGNGQMLHTTSASNPLRVEPITKYSSASRAGTGRFRVLTTAERESLIVQAGWDGLAPKPVTDYSVYPHLQYPAKTPVFTVGGRFCSDVEVVMVTVDKKRTPMLRDKRSSKGYIAALQRALGVKADGYFGPDTQAGVSERQKAAGLPDSGHVGERTWELIEAKS